MEIITLSGTVSSVPESRKDLNGNNYIRFVVRCTTNDHTGDVKDTYYRCLCYDPNMKDLRKGDVVFLHGDLYANITTCDGTPILSCEVGVKCITKAL